MADNADTSDPVDLADTLRRLAEAYPENIFRPLTDEDRKEHAALISRAAAAQARHMAQWLTQAADMIDALRQPAAMDPVPKNEYQLLRDVLKDAREVLFASIKAPDALQAMLGKLNLSCRAHWDYETSRIAQSERITQEAKDWK